MTTSDPIADMLTRIRNAMATRHAKVDVPSSKLKTDIAKILKDEGRRKNLGARLGELPALRSIIRVICITVSVSHMEHGQPHLHEGADRASKDCPRERNRPRERTAARQ
jgi:hypothetical protein